MTEGTPSAEPQVFVVVDTYTTFTAEYTFKDDDVHFHFFLTPETIMKKKEYWEATFPRCLDATARPFFGFEFPRIQANMVRDVLRFGQSENEPVQDSWWMIVQELKVVDPDALVLKFCEALDTALEAATRK